MYLITPTLLNSWQYLYKAFEGYEEDAYNDFLRTLNREPSEPNEAMRAGINFENQINELVRGNYTPNLPAPYYELADIVMHGQEQVALSIEKRISGIDFLLYGRLDYLKAGVIYDIKYMFSKKTKYEMGKYVDSAQHPLYFEICPEAYEFEYLTSDGKELYRERYLRQDAEPIDMKVKEFMAFLAEQKLTEIYFEKWKARD